MNRVAFMVVAGVVGGIAVPALGQVADIAPYYGVIGTDKAPMHCNDSERFYRVADLAPGTVLIVDGEGQGWSRAWYPAGLSAFVRAEDVSVVGEAATLTTPSRLKAANAVAGYDGSYKALFATPLAAGTAFKVMEPVKDNTGTVAGYRVAAPANARGFVETGKLRRATEAEIAAAKTTGVGELPPAPVVVTPPPALSANTPSETTPDGTTPAVEITQATVPATGGVQPASIPGAPATIETTTTPSELGGDRRGTQDSERAVGSVEKLDETFQAVWKQPVLSAEVDELIAEYDRAIAGMPEAQARRRQQLQGRRDALQLRVEYRERLREQEAARAKVEATSEPLNKQLEEIANSRYYTIIGQLQPSLVYDGRQLPQMYRVVSVGGTSPRTLGYLRKTAEQDLDKMLGLIVGVVGDAQLDRSLQLNIITPVHVDVLKHQAAK